MAILPESEVCGFLADPATHGIAEPVKRIETHVSIVFLAGGTAYKMKRAVKFPFLDFTTLAGRKAACEREVEINRRTAPSIYLRAVAVTRERSGGLAIDGTGPAVEWLVEMQRFDEASLFDRLADQERGLRRPMMERLADEIASFHVNAPVRLDRGGAAGLRAIAENNMRSFAALPADCFDPGIVAAVTSKTNDELDAIGALLDVRRHRGMVRECHGDLHLRNICLVDGNPTLFDAIEFSEDFSVIDTLYDLAFLLMDLQSRAHRRLASFVLNRYLDQGDDGADAFRLLPVLQSMRAQIRAHVGAAAANTIGDVAASGQEMQRARHYLELAGDFFKRPAPVLIAVGGLSGSGKSRLSREIAPFVGLAPGARVVRTDAVRKRIAGIGLDRRLGADGYGTDMTERTYAAVADQALAILDTGQSVVIDAVFAKPDQRLSAEKLASKAGVPFIGLWVDASLEVRLGRIASRVNNISDATAEVAERQQQFDLGRIDWHRVDSTGSKDATLAAAKLAISA